jgi:hypothetical protein
METNSLTAQNNLPSPMDVREKISSIETAMLARPDAMIGDCFPLEHTFVPGMYIRQITMPKGSLVISKIHKMRHPYFVLKGDVSVLTEKGIIRIKAPFADITPEGTRRLLYNHEETVWVTVHRTDETDLEKIESEVIAKNFEELEGDIIEIQEFINEVTK